MKLYGRVSNKGVPPYANTNSNYYLKEGELTMPPTSVPPISFGFSSSPPICDDEATTIGIEAKTT